MTAALKQATQLKVQMTVVKGPHVGAVFNFDKPQITIGRGPENDVVLLNDPMVSRAHARVNLNKNEFEVINLSDKNILLVHGESVSKSVLLNDSTFQIGDSEIKFQCDLGQAVVAVPAKPQQGPPLAVVKAKPTQAVAKKPVPPQTPAVKPQTSSVPHRPQMAHPAPGGQPRYPQGHAAPQFQQQHSQQKADEQAKKFRFYAILGVALVVAGYFYLSPGHSKKSKLKPVLKYEDEIAVSINSKSEVDLRRKREDDKKAKDSPTVQRAEENLVKGLRDFQLGNYSRAQDFFQVVLNLAPDHPIAKRYMILSKVRFDELVQAKLVLGESYYQKHNFDMCVSMYHQVMNMLQGKSNDSKFELAKRMAEKCQLASEGIL